MTSDGVFILLCLCLLIPVQMSDVIDEFLSEQVESIKQLAEYQRMLKCVGPGLGEYQFDKMTLDG